SAAAAMSYEAAMAELAAHQPIAVGTGVRHLASLIRPEHGITPDTRAADQPRATVIAERAALRTPPAEPPVPFYLRPPDAKLPQ
ncbi:MAG: hypothetical protein ACR2PM_05130, partial [Hyphomicrobiales bacterium]